MTYTQFRILLGMMLPTWFLSMWISNTASAAMMLPIARAVVDQIGEGVRVQQATRKKSRPSDGDNSTTHKNEDKGQTLIYNRRGSVHHDDGHHDDRHHDNNHHDDGHHDDSRYDESHHDNSHHDDNHFDETRFGYENSVAMDILDNGLAESSETIDTSTAKDVSKEAKALEAGAESTKVDTAPVTVIDEAELQKRLINFGKMLNLAVAYSATIGGTATLTGTPPNLVFQKYLNALYESHGLPPPVNFPVWLFFGLPHAILCFIVTLVWLQLFYLGWRSFCFCCVKDHESDDSSEGIRTVIQSEYDSLGRIRFAESATCGLFVLLVILWFVRDPGVFEGYTSLFKKGYVTDCVPAIFVAIFLFAFPAEVPRMFCLRRKGEPSRRLKPLLEWEYVSSRFPWGVLIILGGGFALAEGCQMSGLSRIIGTQLQTLSSLPPWLMILVVVVIIAIFTEVTSNTAVATIVIPILCQMAENVNVNPLYLTLPAAMATSYAFMLPVASGVQAVVFSYGSVTVLDMVKVGFMLNIVCVLIVTVGIHTWGRLVFDLDLLPWNHTNPTIDAL